MSDLFEKYNPNQPRDDHGRWSSGGTYYHVTLAKNVPSILKRGLIPQVGSRSASLGEKAGGTYLFSSKTAAADALTNWLGDELPEDEEVALLRIKLPKDAKLGVGANFETVVKSTIAPEHISVVRDPLFKGVAGAPSLTHQPGKLQLHRGGKKRRHLGRSELFQKDAAPAPAPNVGADSVHVNSALAVRNSKKPQKPIMDFNGWLARASREKPLLEAADEVLEKKTSPEDRAKIKQVMDEWKAGKLHSGSKKGPVVESQEQAIAIALNSIDKRARQLFEKADQYHDENGRFTSADSAVDPQGSRDQRKPRSAPAGYHASQALAGAAGDLGGSMLGRVGGAALGALTGPAAPIALPALSFAGSIAGGAIGDIVSRKIASTAYSMMYPKFNAPKQNLGQDIGGSLGATLGYYAAGPLASGAARLAEGAAGAAGGSAVAEVIPSVAAVTAHVLGQAYGEVRGTRFGGFVASKVGGALARHKDALSQGGDLAASALGEAGEELTKVKLGRFPALRLRNDQNDRAMLSRSAPDARFRTMLNDLDNAERSKAARAAMFGRRLEGLQVRPGQTTADFKATLMRARRENASVTSPWSSNTSR